MEDGAGGLDVAGARKPDQRSRDERQAPFSLHCGFLATRVMSYYSWDPLLFGSSCLFSLVLKEPSFLMYLISWGMDDVMKSFFSFWISEVDKGVCGRLW